MADTIITKQCSECKDFKPLSDFHKENKVKDGHRSDCKICRLKYDKEYRQTDNGKAVHLKALKKYRQSEKYRANKKRFKARHPNQGKAVNAVNHAIEAGKLCRPNTLLCHYCPKPAQQYHHWRGYEPEYWLDIIPVCRKCHNNISNVSTIKEFATLAVGSLKTQ